MKKLGVVLLFLILLSSIVYAGELKVTDEHPFLINNKWIPANQLNIGDNLTLADERQAVITDIKKVSLENPVKVYNLETENYHDFIVNGVIVHNSNAVPANSLRVIETEKIKEAKILLNRHITQLEEESIINAHYAKTIDEKARILEKAGFSTGRDGEVRTLIENYICGKIYARVVTREEANLIRRTGTLIPVVSGELIPVIEPVSKSAIKMLSGLSKNQIRVLYRQMGGRCRGRMEIILFETDTIPEVSGIYSGGLLESKFRGEVKIKVLN